MNYASSCIKENELEQPKVSTFGAFNVASIEQSNQFSLAMFKHLKDISKECDTDLRVIFTGVQEKNNFGTYPTLEFLDYARKIRFFEEEGITFIDLTSNPHLIDYRKNLKKYTIKNDGHPNEAGAELLFKAINQSGII